MKSITRAFWRLASRFSRKTPSCEVHPVLFGYIRTVCRKDAEVTYEERRSAGFSVLTIIRNQCVEYQRMGRGEGLPYQFSLYLLVVAEEVPVLRPATLVLCQKYFPPGAVDLIEDFAKASAKPHQ